MSSPPARKRLRRIRLHRAGRFGSGDFSDYGDTLVGNLSSDGVTRPRSFRAALLGAAAVAAVGGLRWSAATLDLPRFRRRDRRLRRSRLFRRCGRPRQKRGRFREGQGRGNQRLVRWRRPADAELPQGRAAREPSTSSRSAALVSVAARTMSSPTWAWPRARASSFPPTAISSPITMSSSTPRT